MPGNFEFRNLTQETRSMMLTEVDSDQASGVLYPSACFNETGPGIYPVLLREAITSFEEAWLGDQLRTKGCFGERYVDSNGKDSKVPTNAHERFAQGEFNRFYIRSLCLQALSNPDKRLIVYRARESSFKRPESEAKIGKTVSAQEVLDDLRTSIGTGTFFGVPEANSGLSLELI